jgi:hypothetical protein
MLGHFKAIRDDAAAWGWNFHGAQKILVIFHMLCQTYLLCKFIQCSTCMVTPGLQVGRTPQIYFLHWTQKCLTLVLSIYIHKSNSYIKMNVLVSQHNIYSSRTRLHDPDQYMLCYWLKHLLYLMMQWGCATLEYRYLGKKNREFIIMLEVKHPR